MSTPLNHSLLKGFEVLALFRHDRPEITAAALTAEMGMNSATAHRFLTTLEQAGAIVAVRRGAYRLSPRLAELGRLAEDTNPLPRIVGPLIEALAAILGQSVMVCLPGPRGPVAIAVATPPRPFAMGFAVGTTVSLTGSAQGRLWLADMAPSERPRAVTAAGEDPELLAPLAPMLEQIRSEGLAHNRGEAAPEVGAIAAPVHDGRGRLALTLSVFGPLSQFTPVFRDHAAGPLRDLATRIGQRL